MSKIHHIKVNTMNLLKRDRCPELIKCQIFMKLANCPEDIIDHFQKLINMEKHFQTLLIPKEKISISYHTVRGGGGGVNRTIQYKT